MRRKDDGSSQFIHDSIPTDDVRGVGRISGSAIQAADQGKPSWFDVPAISNVAAGLWQGGCLPGEMLPDDFKYVVSLYPWGQWELPDGCSRQEFRLYDSTDQGFEQIEGIAARVIDFWSYGKTLVHCQAGLNRSALVVGTALVRAGQFTGPEVVDHLRAWRHEVVLCNPAFEAYLRAL
jgi:hypothetical protein